MNRRRFLKVTAGGIITMPAIVRAQTMANALSFLDACNYHPTAVNWASRVVANGAAAPSSATTIALSSFMYAWDSAGLTSKTLSACFFPSDSLIAATTPFLKTVGNDPWTNVNSNFTSGDLGVNGMTGNHSTKVLNTGVTPANFPGTFTGALIVYSFSLGTSSSGFDLGSASNTSPDCGLSVIFTPNPNGSTIFDWTNGSTSRVTLANNGWKGFTCGSSTAANARAVYIASSTHAFSTLGTSTNDITGNSLPSVSFSAFGYTSGVGTPTGNSDRTLSFIGIMGPMTSGDAQNAYNAIQALRVAMGGGWV